MRVKVLVSLSGSAFSCRPGDALEVDDAEAGRLIAAGFAAPPAAGEKAPPPVTVTAPVPPPASVETTKSVAATKREKAIAGKKRGKG